MSQPKTNQSLDLDREMLSPEEQKAIAELDVAGRQLEESMRKIGFTADDFASLREPNVKEDFKAISELDYAFDRRGEKFYTNEEIHRRYKQASPIFKWTTLPYCRRTIIEKAKFWLVGSPILGTSLAQFQISRSDGRIKSLPIRTYILYTLGFAVFGVGLSFAESLLIDDYCDVNSYHYSLDTDRLALSRKVKQSLGTLSNQKPKDK